MKDKNDEDLYLVQTFIFDLKGNYLKASLKRFNCQTSRSK